MPEVRSLHPRAPLAAPRSLAKLAVVVVALLAPTLLALSGCGSSATGTAASPATVVPAAAPLYIDAVVQPSGSLESNALAVGRSLTQRSNPYNGLLALLRGPGGKTPDYASEVKPWLGPNAGVFLSSVEGGKAGASDAQELLREALSKALSEGFAGAESALLGANGLPRLLGSSTVQGALVLNTSDVAKARTFLEGQAHSAGAHTTSYRGVSFQVAPDGIAEGIVHRFAVIGSEAGLKSVIDTAAGSAALSGAPAYTKLVATAASGRLTNAYLDLEALTSSIKAGAQTESLLALLRGLLGQAANVYVSAIPAASSLAFDLDTLPSAAGGDTTGEGTGGSQEAGGAGKNGESSTGGEGKGAGTTGAQVLSGLPGDAWLAIGFGDLGKALGSNSAQALSAIASLASGLSFGTISPAKVFAPLQSPAINVQRDLLSWAGPTGIYVSGSSVLNLQAALVITATNPARARAAVTKLASAYREAGGQTSPTSIAGAETAVTVRLPNFPLPLALAYGQGKLVFGLGPASVQEALSPQSTLAGTPAYNSAASALGEGIEPSAAIEFSTLTGLIESLGLSQAPGFSGIAQALKPLASLAAGGGKQLGDGVKRSRLVLGLASSG